MTRLLWLTLLLPTLQAQEETLHTFRSEARVLTIDAMVRDTATRKPVEQLRKSDFRLRIDGKERQITYFGQTGTDRRPLAMLVFLNLAPEGGLRELSDPAALASFTQALGKLEPGDEVAIYATRDWFVGGGKEMCGLTKDRQAAAKAMQESLVMAESTTAEERKADRDAREKSMGLAIVRAMETARLRPDSQIALVYISDGMNTLDTMEARGRRELSAKLHANGISFSALNLRMLTSYAAAAAVINPIGAAFGLSVTGSANHLAKQAGGLTVEVAAPARLGAALEEVLSSYVSRYSLGYQVSESEYRDGKAHRIELKLRGEIAGGREVLARKSFVGRREPRLRQKGEPTNVLPADSTFRPEI